MNLRHLKQIIIEIEVSYYLDKNITTRHVKDGFA